MRTVLARFLGRPRAETNGPLDELLTHRINPRDPLVSPLFGDLSSLPPTLTQASWSEMFLDDAVRYANKATAQGSRVILETWPHTMHGWHAMEVREADGTFDEVRAFLGAVAPVRARDVVKR